MVSVAMRPYHEVQGAHAEAALEIVGEARALPPIDQDPLRVRGSYEDSIRLAYVNDLDADG